MITGPSVGLLTATEAKVVKDISRRTSLSAPPPVKTKTPPLKSPSVRQMSEVTAMYQNSFTRFTVACTVATTVMTQLGQQDPLTQMYF